jgi:hypothetical protein
MSEITNPHDKFFKASFSRLDVVQSFIEEVFPSQYSLDDSALIETSHADPNSIMCYWLPASIMKDNVAVAGGTDIYSQDAQFASSVYPLNNWGVLKIWEV